MPPFHVTPWKGRRKGGGGRSRIARWQTFNEFALFVFVFLSSFLDLLLKVGEGVFLRSAWHQTGNPEGKGGGGRGRIQCSHASTSFFLFFLSFLAHQGRSLSGQRLLDFQGRKEEGRKGGRKEGRPIHKRASLSLTLQTKKKKRIFFLAGLDGETFLSFSPTTFCDLVLSLSSSSS